MSLRGSFFIPCFSEPSDIQKWWFGIIFYLFLTSALNIFLFFSFTLLYIIFPAIWCSKGGKTW
jgi:hypothetical protein